MYRRVEIIIVLLLAVLAVSIEPVQSQVMFPGVVASAGKSTLSDGLLAHWKFDETTGDPQDEMGTYDGVASNITYNANGKVGRCFSFNGTSSKVQVGSGETGFPKPTSAGSYVLWFKTSTGGDSRLLYAIAGNSGIVLYWNYADPSWTTGNGSATQEDGFTPDATWNDGAWHLLIISWDGTNKYAYIDGNSKMNVSWAYSVAWGTTEALTIGANDYGSGWWTGDMDEVRVYNRTLTSSERSELQSQ